jgi:hypothetical protein
MRYDLGGHRLGLPKPRQVDRDDIELVGQSRKHRVPSLACGSEAVQQHQGRAGAISGER